MTSNQTFYSICKSLKEFFFFMHGKENRGSEIIVLDSDEDERPPSSISTKNRVSNASSKLDVIALDKEEEPTLGVTAKQFRDKFDISIGSKPSEVQVFISNVPHPSRKRPNTARKSMSSFTPKFSEVIDLLSDEEEAEEVSKHSSEQKISLPHDAFEQFLNQVQISLKSSLEKYKNIEKSLTAAYEAACITPKIPKHLHSFLLQLTLNLSLNSDKVDQYVEEVKNKLKTISLNKEAKKCVEDISHEKGVPSKKRKLESECASSSKIAFPQDQSSKIPSCDVRDSISKIIFDKSVSSNKRRIVLESESSSKSRDPGLISSQNLNSKATPSGETCDSKSKIIVNKQKKTPAVLELDDEDCFVKETRYNGLKKDKATSLSINKSINDSHLRKLKNALEECGKEIRRLELAEIDSNDDESTYVLMYKYKRRFMSIYNKIIELEDNLPKWKSQTQISRHPEINERICKVINQGIKTSLQHSYFPDFQDIMNIYEEVNKSSCLGMQKEELYEEASDAFQKIGRKLQSRRKYDVYASMESYLQENESEPVLSDEFQERLKHNKTIADESLDQVIHKFTLKQSAPGSSSTISRPNKEGQEENDGVEEDDEEDIESVSSISSLSDDDNEGDGVLSSNDSDGEGSSDDE
ncbi:uncharacterized protein [Lepeophtheirus salmonis]|uniref:uncharacterized protein isoform X2 n=1 Tax=Lepeophtheirus salmonis TaxID=72036 RepID=UPI001AE97FFD|nr:uncharacterized protein LOC121127521 isoform X2 [Lepeophtheirus salmonis]